MAASEKVPVEIDGRRLLVSNLDKILYPEAGFTKADIIDYYVRIAPVMLPHVEGRGVTLRRWPDGVHRDSFFEKRCPSHKPDWLPAAAGPGNVDKQEVEIDPDYGLDYKYIIAAISSCSGKMVDGKMVRYISKIKFAPIRQP